MKASWARCLFLAGLTAAVFLAASSAVGKDEPAEAKNLEGTWQLLSALKNGKETPAETVKKIQVVIKGGKHSVRFDGEVVVKEIPFQIDATKKPKETTDTLPDGKVIRGIFKIEGDLLTSCVAEPDRDRPRDSPLT